MHFVHYLYTYRIDYYQFALTDDDYSWLNKALKLLVVADRYGQLDLLSDCETLLMALLTVDNACEIFQVANKLNVQVNKCLKLMVIAVACILCYTHLSVEFNFVLNTGSGKNDFETHGASKFWKNSSVRYPSRTDKAYCFQVVRHGLL